MIEPFERYSITLTGTKPKTSKGLSELIGNSLQTIRPVLSLEYDEILDRMIITFQKLEIPD